MGPDRIQARVPIRRRVEALGGALDRLLFEPIPTLRGVRRPRIT